MSGRNPPYWEILQERSGVIVTPETFVSATYGTMPVASEEFFLMGAESYYTNSLTVVETLSHIIIVTGGRVKAVQLNEDRYIKGFESPEEEKSFVIARLEIAVSALGGINYPLAKNVRAILIYLIQSVREDTVRDVAALFDSIVALAKGSYWRGRHSTTPAD